MGAQGWGVRALGGTALGLLLLASPATADPARAQAAYAQGQRLQAAKQWPAAAAAYQEALKEDPSDPKPYKALGTVYYLAGDRRGALSYYRRYLRAVPGDSATKAFADRLQASLPAAEGATPAARPRTSGHFNPGFDVRAGLDAVFCGGSDLAKLVGSDATVAPATALGYGLGVDYGLANGFVAGLDLMLGPNRSHAVSYPGGMSETFAISHLAAFAQPGWRFPVGPVVLEPRLGLGLMTASMTVSAPGYAGSTATGSGYGLWPSLRAEYEWGCWGFGAELGYLYSAVSPMVFSGGNATNHSDGSVWTLSTSGPSLGLELLYHFTPLLR